MTSVVTITLPPPNARLHAHAKGHWRNKANATRDLRALAKYETMQTALRVKFSRAEIQYRFYFRDNRRRDAANCIHSMKAAIDGVVDAGLIPDDDWQHLSIAGVQCTVDKDNPRTELVFTRV